MNFEFATAGRVVFGEGRAREAGALAGALGRRALVVHSGRGVADPVIASLRASGLDVREHVARGEPTVAMAVAGADAARESRSTVVVAVGGGSVLDLGKAIAALATNTAPVARYLEVVGEGKTLDAAPLPVVAVPTTAGTGSEVTRNAVLLVEEARVKVSLRSPRMLPAVALVDPELAYGLPAEVTASTGLDALTQCLEPFVSHAATPLTDGVAREGLVRAAGALARAVRDGGDRDARRDMAVASLCGGLALANAKLGAVHGFAAPLGGMFPVPHGVACARLLAPVARANVRALREREPSSPALARYDEAARLFTRRPDARAEEGAEWLAALVESLGVPRLADFGVREEHVAELIAKARGASSMQGNPIVITDEELAGALRSSL